MAADHEGFSCSFMLMKPEDVSFLNLLIYILFSSTFEDRNPADSSAASDESFGYRKLVLKSILLQKFLVRVAKPLETIGSSIEIGLNLLSSNGDLFSLIFNTIHGFLFDGKLVIPDKTSQNFFSIIGNVDKRQTLDRNIKPGDPRYNAAIAMMASKLSYENKACIEYTVTQHWKMQFLGFYEYWNDFQEKSSTQAFMMRDKADGHDTIVVAFRGTLPFDVAAWCSDFDISWYRIPKVGKVHGGFMKALGLQKRAGFPKDVIEEEDHAKMNRPLPLAYYDIREKLRELLRQNDNAKYVLTGHSLGGALAILFRAILALHEETFLLERLEGVYTFGQPRVGDEKFGEFMKKEIIENDHTRYFRFVYCNDVVPRLPYDHKPLMFKHFGTCLHSDRNYKVKIGDDEPSKYYFSRRNAIAMRINSLLELIRSFAIPYTKGPEFKEGKLMRLFRVIGLVIPGFPAHSPQDYVNTTRLASKEVFLPPKNSSQKKDSTQKKTPIISG